MGRRIFLFILFVVLCLVVWFGFDFLVETVIFHRAYTFSLMKLSTALAVGVVVGYFSFLRNNNKKQDK